MEVEQTKIEDAGYQEKVQNLIYRWYVIHTYSGYENKVKSTLELKIQSMGMQDEVRNILIPMEDGVDEKDGVKKTVKRKIFPGYVLVEMKVEQSTMKINPRSWYVVRNTPGVTGFVGSATEPVPLSGSEVESILKSQGMFRHSIDMEIGDKARIASGSFEDMIGTITEINFEKGKVTMAIEMFNRDTSVEVAFSDIEKL